MSDGRVELKLEFKATYEGNTLLEKEITLTGDCPHVCFNAGASAAQTECNCIITKLREKEAELDA